MGIETHDVLSVGRNVLLTSDASSPCAIENNSDKTKSQQPPLLTKLPGCVKHSLLQQAEVVLMFPSSTFNT